MKLSKVFTYFLTCWSLAVILVGCQATPPAGGDPLTPPPESGREPYSAATDGPGSDPVNLARLKEPKPKSEPLSRSGNRSSYRVMGKTYQVWHQVSKGHKETGIASWYGKKFQGRTTSGGERYDMYQLTGAHRNLPLPSYVRVTNLENNQSAVVKINDRGPFHSSRIIDLSYAAAIKLGFASRGTAKVSVEVLAVPYQTSKNQPLPKLGSAHQKRPGLGQYFVQVGAFASQQSAQALKNQLQALSQPASIVLSNSASGSLHKVRLGPYQTLELARATQADIQSYLGRSTPAFVVLE